MPKKNFFFLAILIISLLGTGCGKKEVEQTANIVTGYQDISFKNKAERDLAIAQSKELYRIKKAEGVDFSNGPCLSNQIISDWVADIAHQPRKTIDNRPENQCPAFREGKAHHFVELDLEGNLIRAQ